MSKTKVDGEQISSHQADESGHPEMDQFQEGPAEVESSEELHDPEGLEDIALSEEDPDVSPSVDIKVKELNDRHLRLAAEFDNYRKRTRKEKEDFHQFATADLIGKLLPVLDSLSRGVEFNAKAECVESVKEGLIKVNRLFGEILEKEGLSVIDESGVPLDINLHMAVFQEEREDVEDQTVLEIFEKGYSLRGKVLRPAKVKVSKSSEAESSESTDQDIDSENAELKSND